MGPGSQGPVVIGVAVGFAVVTLVVISLRLFARMYVLRKMGFDDYLIIGACLFAWAFSAVTVVAVKHGLGSHMKYIGMSDLQPYSFAVWLSSMFYLATLGFVKTSVCWFYTRLGAKYLTRVSYIMMGVVSCQATSFVLVAAFQCQPIPKAWNSALPGQCVNINVFYLANAALNIFTDVLTYSLPVRVVFQLQMPPKQKAVLGLILCLGLFACVSSIIRITYIPAMLTSPDATYAISGAMYWSVIEINVGILAASIPSFKAIASRFLPRIIGEYTSNRHYGTWSDDPRKYGSNFSRIRDGSIPFGSVSKKMGNDASMGTQIGRTTSEDRIFVPEGRIFAKTEIETNVEETRDCSNHSSSLERGR